MPPFLMLIFGLALLFAGAGLLVQGASRLAQALRIPGLVVGMTIISYGTGSPELAVGIEAGLERRPDLVTGMLVGGTIFNLLVVLGLAALIAPLKITSRLVRMDIPLLLLITGLVWLFALDGRIGLAECILLLLLLPAHTVFSGYYARKLSDGERYVPPSRLYGIPLPPLNFVLVLFLLGGIAFLFLGARQVVACTLTMTNQVGLDELTMGLLVVAAGTALPELATSLIACIHGERNIAVGNVVGACLFNLVCVLPAAGLAHGNGLAINGILRELDFPATVAATLLCLPVFLTGTVISRFEGFFFLLFYAFYAAMALLRNAASPLYAVLAEIFFYILLPCALFFVVLILWFAYYEVKLLATNLSDDFYAMAMPALKNTRKIVIAVVGTTLILGGLAMMVLPGPATVVIPLGLAILSTEFIWARRLLHYIRKEMESAARRLTGAEEAQETKSIEPDNSGP